MHDEKSDVQLMMDVKNGDESAFDEIVRRYYKRILNTAFKFTGDEHIANDLTQDVFLNLYSARKSYKPTACLSTFIYTIAHNVCYNYLRSRGLKSCASLDENIPVKHSNLTIENLPIEKISKEEIKMFVRKAIGLLPPNQRMVIILDTFEQLSYNEISDVMKISVSAVKSLLFRARHNLCKMLLKHKDTVK